jgi:hypothetical protein
MIKVEVKIKDDKYLRMEGVALSMLATTWLLILMIGDAIREHRLQIWWNSPKFEGSSWVSIFANFV